MVTFSAAVRIPVRLIQNAHLSFRSELQELDQLCDAPAIQRLHHLEKDRQGGGGEGGREGERERERDRERERERENLQGDWSDVFWCVCVCTSVFTVGGSWLLFAQQGRSGQYCCAITSN